MATRKSIQKSIPVVKATSAEMDAVRRGRREHARGEFVTIEQLKHDLEVDRLKERSQKTKKVSH